MSSLVLARKYRPRRFDQMVGQDHVVRAVTNALRTGRLHHAYLFTGTRGVGKTTVSRILAKSLNCTGPDGLGGITDQPCGQCQACTEIDADRYIDYIEMDAASNRSIDEIRDLIERAAYKPAVGRFKVFMIDEAHQLTKEAFNALLKTLEEPPDYLKFVLATTDPQRMLPTVLSRCLQFNLRPMSAPTVAAHLQAVLDAEAVLIEPGAVRLLSHAARGSMRDALSLTDQAIAYGAGSVREDAVRAMLGAVDRSHAEHLVSALALRDAALLLQGVDTLRELGLSAVGTLEEMAMLLQQMAVLQALPSVLDEQDPQARAAMILAQQMAADDTQLLYSICLQGKADLHLLGDEYAALTMVLLRLLAFPAENAQAPRAASQALRVAGAAARSSLPVRAGDALVSRPAAAPPLPMPAAAQTSASSLTAIPEPSPPAHAASAPAQALAARDNSLEPPDWLTEPDRQEAAVLAAPPAPQTPITVVSVATPRLQPTALGQQWVEVVRRLELQSGFGAMVRELAIQCEWVDWQPQAQPPQIRLRVERDSLRAPALAQRLQELLAASEGQAWLVQVEAGPVGDSVSLRDGAARAQAQQQAEQTIRDDPAIQELMAQFRTARIVPGSIRSLTEPQRNTKP